MRHEDYGEDENYENISRIVGNIIINFIKLSLVPAIRIITNGIKALADLTPEIRVHGIKLQ
jgi:hypothetical protein